MGYLLQPVREQGLPPIGAGRRDVHTSGKAALTLSSNCNK